MPENVIRSIFKARIKQLMAQYEESKGISHASTIGTMREQYLKNFLRDLLPAKYAPISGFISDMYGNITPQLDLIFFAPLELPTIALVNDTTIVPAEIALMTAEVKSTITTETLEQIKKQRESIENELQSSYLGNNLRSPSVLPTFVIAFGSDVNKDTLEGWVNDISGLIGICVIKGRNAIAIYPTFPRQRQDGKTKFDTDVLNSNSADNYERLLTFIGAIYRLLYIAEIMNSTNSGQMRQNRFSSPMWAWEAYLSETMYNFFQRPQN